MRTGRQFDLYEQEHKDSIIKAQRLTIPQLPGPGEDAVLTHLLAAHPSAGHLEIVFTQAVWAQRVMRASLEQGPDRLL